MINFVAAFDKPQAVISEETLAEKSACRRGNSIELSSTEKNLIGLLIKMLRSFFFHRAFCMQVKLIAINLITLQKEGMGIEQIYHPGHCHPE